LDKDLAFSRTMKTKNARRKTASVPNSRWVAYATAGAATAFAGIGTAEATIHHVNVNQAYAPTPGSSTVSVFSLGAGAQFSIRAFLHSSGINGHASFGLAAPGGVSAKFLGYTVGPASGYVSKLAANAAIAGGFISNGQIGNYFAYLERHTTGMWGTAGIGFVGFKFNTGAGTQFGWARFNMNGAPGNTYTLVDFAWGDPGDSLVTGQVPEPGSLGLLALGGVGLLAWRKRRLKAVMPG
jgi:hypothetical protein